MYIGHANSRANTGTEAAQTAILNRPRSVHVTVKRVRCLVPMWQIVISFFDATRDRPE